MLQVYKTFTGKGLVEYSVTKNRLDEAGYFRIEYKLYTFADEKVLLDEFQNVVITQLSCVIERNEQDGSHGYLYLVPIPQNEPSQETLRS
jgi:hypothetical protein